MILIFEFCLELVRANLLKKLLLKVANKANFMFGG